MFRIAPYLLGTLLLAGSASAQTAPDAPPADITPSDDCQLPPTDNDTTTAPSATGGDLTSTLDNCNGVLRPPAVGDSGIVAPAPSTGETPVIRPETLPEQPSTD